MLARAYIPFCQVSKKDLKFIRLHVSKHFYSLLRKLHLYANREEKTKKIYFYVNLFQFNKTNCFDIMYTSPY